MAYVRRYLLTFLLALCLLVTNTGISYALPSEHKAAIDRNSPHYVKGSAGSDECSSSGNTPLQGNDNIEKTWNFLVGKGFTPEQTAGLVGNFMWESGGINPKSQNGIGAYGIAQWLGGRKASLLAKDNYDTLGVQLDFVWEEMKGSEGAAYQAITAVSGTGREAVNTAAQVVMDKYERPGDNTLPDRQENARGAYDLYSGNESDSGGVTSDGCNGWSGGDTLYTDDGFIVYSQYDPAWKDKPYGSSTIGDSGCGPSAMAMIITNLKDTRVTPVDTSNYAASKGLLVDGGSSWTIGPILAEHWGLRSEAIGNSITAINAALGDGGMVIASGNGAVPFTTGGHYIVIRGVTADGKWKVGDSAHSDSNNAKWDPSAISAGIGGKGGSVYAIYKN